MSASVRDEDFPPLATIGTLSSSTPQHRHAKEAAILRKDQRPTKWSPGTQKESTTASRSDAGRGLTAQESPLTEQSSPARQEPIPCSRHVANQTPPAQRMSSIKQSPGAIHNPATQQKPMGQREGSEDLEMQLRHMIRRNGVPSDHRASRPSGAGSQRHPDDMPLDPSIQSPQKSISGGVAQGNIIPHPSMTSQAAPGDRQFNTRGPFVHRNQHAPINRPPPRWTHDPSLPPPRFDRLARLDEQCRYVEQIASVEISNAEMLPAEKLEREDLRCHLERICRDTITSHERVSNPVFEPESIVLECFGSLKSGFATRGSDMDLVIISPQSKYDPASPKSEIPRMLEQIFLASGFGVRLLTRTRVPIIRGCQRPSPELLEGLVAERVNFDATQDSLSKSSDKSVCKKFEDCSDIELARLYSIATSEGWYNEAERRIIYRFIQDLKVSQNNPLDEFLVASRASLKSLPDILSRFRELPEERIEIPKTGVGIHWDLNFSNHLARHNTKLLYCYSLCDQRIHGMVIFVKAWAKRRGINSAYQGTLSSYGYVLMVLHYAVNIANPPLAPNLQHQLGPERGGSPSTAVECDGHNVQFWRNEADIELARKRGQLTYSKESLGSLLRGFFQYFAEFTKQPGLRHDPFHWQNDVLSLRTDGGILSKQEKGWMEAKTETLQSASPLEKPVEIKQRYLLSIEDPFEIDHNVARPVTKDGVYTIRNEFQRANRIIKTLGIVDNIALNLFEENAQPQLERKMTHFGPHPSTFAKRRPRSDQQANGGPTKQSGHDSRLLMPRIQGQAGRGQRTTSIETESQRPSPQVSGRLAKQSEQGRRLLIPRSQGRGDRFSQTTIAVAERPKIPDEVRYAYIAASIEEKKKWQ